jgi:putative addiction module component (TIGR02574 family)
MSTFDFTTLTPVERIALADALYDSAMQEIDAMVPQLTAEQLDDLDRRIGEVAAGHVELMPWDELHTQLNQR